MQWRRDQVTNLVRRVSIEAKAINPRIKISAALIPWGQPPTNESDFEDAAPMQRIFQNWHQWLKDGLLDLGVPMNYATETDERVRGWFDGWIRWEKSHPHGRQLAVGLGAYRNTPAATLAQVARARADDGGRRVVGCRSSPTPCPCSRPPSSQGPICRRFRSQAATGWRFLPKASTVRRGVFARPAPVPAMPWIVKPETGWIAGTRSSGDTAGNDGVTVRQAQAILAVREHHPRAHRRERILRARESEARATMKWSWAGTPAASAVVAGQVTRVTRSPGFCGAHQVCRARPAPSAHPLQRHQRAKPRGVAPDRRRGILLQLTRQRRKLRVHPIWRSPL